MASKVRVSSQEPSVPILEMILEVTHAWAKEGVKLLKLSIRR